MTQEIVVVTELGEGGVWVEGTQKSACNSCNARSGCGQHSLSKLGRPMRLWVPTEQTLQVGQEAVLSMPGGGLAISALLLYGLPLLTLLTGASIGQSHGDITAALGALAGLAGGFILARIISGHYQDRWQPKLLPGCDQISVISAD